MDLLKTIGPVVLAESEDLSVPVKETATTSSPTPPASTHLRLGTAEADGEGVQLAVPEQMGGRMMAELVGAFNELTERMGGGGLVLSSSLSHLLFKSLKLSIPLLHSLPFGPDGRSPLSRALSVACLLADLQMDAEVISASLLRVGLETCALTMRDVRCQIGRSTAHLLHENMRLTKLPSTVEILDNDTASILRRFCLTHYDIRAMVLELALQLDKMRHLDHLPRYNQQVVSLEVLQIYAPLAHSIGAGTLSLELEDLSFRYLFPYSYIYIDTWLRTLESSGKSSLHICKELLHEALKADQEMQELIDDALQLDKMRHLDHLPRYNQQVVSLEVLQIYAPLAHSIGAGTLSLELEDLSFRYLFPYSYIYIDTWLRTLESSGKSSLHICKELLHEALKADQEMQELIDDVTIKSRYKSLFSTMKKLLKDGRRPEDVHDLLGLRIILNPRPGDNMTERGDRACHRVHEVIQSLWKDVPNRTKDYISIPKKNGYRSLHVAVDFSSKGKARPLMEIQIRTAEMDTLAGGGTASHSLYKGGLTDPTEAKRLKAIMLAAAQFAAVRLRDISVENQVDPIETEQRDPVFRFLDKNGDGRISMNELAEVIEELGAKGDDAQELMQLLDVNSDGSLSSDEFDSFQRQVKFMRDMEKKDGQCRVMLGEKLQISTGLIQVYRKELGERLAVT